MEVINRQCERVGLRRLDTRVLRFALKGGKQGSEKEIRQMYANPYDIEEVIDRTFRRMSAIHIQAWPSSLVTI